MFLPLSFFLMTDSFQLEAFKYFLLGRLAGSIFLVIIFYFNLNVLTPNILKRKKIVFSLGVLIVGLFVLLYSDNEFIYNMPPPRPQLPDLMQPSLTYMRPPIPSDKSGLSRLLGTVLSFSLVIGVSTAMALQRDRLRQKDEKQAIVLEKMAAELSILKLQISPHFLFNTLNNIRWLARQKSEKTEGAIVTLSQLLRYIIYQAHNEKVLLEQEINHLKNFIDLQKMRLTQPNSVVFNCEGDIKQHLIEPLLFIPFVENAFKYGVHSQHISDIVFSIKITDNTLVFETHNTIFTDNLPKEAGSSGIGIQNVQKRLALSYPNRHELRLNTEGGVFYVYLKIMVTI
jgi:sensor histidine kinase YesM